MASKGSGRVTCDLHSYCPVVVTLIQTCFCASKTAYKNLRTFCSESAKNFKGPKKLRPVDSPG